MGLPRVRCSVGTLLWLVVVLALNLAVARWFWESYEDVAQGASTSTIVIVDPDLGALPLANAALIGTALFAVRWLRRLYKNDEAIPRPRMSAFAYFSVWLLVLWVVVVQFDWETVYALRQKVEAAQYFVAPGWAWVFGHPGYMPPWIVTYCAIPCLVISGPALGVALAAHVVARRCAVTLPRRRFLALKVLVSIGFGGSALAILVMPREFETEEYVDLDFRVTDTASGEPVRDAFVWMPDPFSDVGSGLPPRALTDAFGQARLTGPFVVSGERNAFQATGTFSPWGRWLEVSAVGYRTIRIPLTDVLGPLADLESRPRGTIRLTKGETPPKRFADVAGVYRTCGRYPCRWFAIEADGRFAWSDSGCFPLIQREYGYVTRRGQDLELASVPHFGSHNSMVASRYRVIEWGGTRYLSAVDDDSLRNLCREALMPDRPPRPGFSVDRYVLSSDEKKPRRGLPRLPLRIWVGFVVEEMGLANKDGSLRRWLDSLARRAQVGRARVVVTGERIDD